MSAAADRAVPPVGWGVIGHGWVARDHGVPAIRAAHGARLAGIADPAFAPGARTPDGAPCHATAEALLADPAVEAVYVATPNHLHAEHVAAAAAAGRHVLCEKPMAATIAEARGMAETMAAAGRVYATAYDQRFHPAHRRLAALVAEGALGQVTQARIHYACWLPPAWSADNWRADPARAGGGAAIDLAPHGLDLLATLIGERPDRLDAHLQRAVQAYPVDDGAMLTAAFPSGCLATLAVGYNCPDALPRRRLELVGTRAMALAEDTMGQVPGGRLTLIDAATGAARDEPFDTAGDPFTAQIEAFSAHLRHGAPFPGTAEGDVALTALLLDALARAPVAGPRPGTAAADAPTPARETHDAA